MMYENGDMLQYYADKAREKKTGKPFVDRGSWDYNPKTDKVEPGYHLKGGPSIITTKKKNESITRAKKLLETITLTTSIDRPRFWSVKNGMPTRTSEPEIINDPVEIPWGRNKRIIRKDGNKI